MDNTVRPTGEKLRVLNGLAGEFDSTGPICSLSGPRHWRRSFLALLMITSSIIFLIAATAHAQVGPNFFGMHMNGGVINAEPWPVDSFGTIRLWDSAVPWALINTSNGVYDWSGLDIWMNHAQQHSVNILYAFGRTPRWASSKPTDTTCANGPGQCDPPNDLKPDGTGTNQHWKSFVTAIAKHAAGRIRYWEVWNEAPNPRRWTGTVAQMLRMASDARAIIKSIDPSAIILSPSTGIASSTQVSWMSNYLAAGGGKYADVIAVHGYVQHGTVLPVPEDLIGFMSSFRSMLASHSQGTKPIWDTEVSWGVQSITGLTDKNLQAGFVARLHFMHSLTRIQRVYWYEWNNATAGTLWLADPNDPSAPGTVLKPGIAYQQVYNWIVGATLAKSCTTSGTIWQCGLTRPNGYVALAVWDRSKTCSPCTYTSYKVPLGYTKYRDLSGHSKAITSTTVPIGYQPILLQK